MDKRLDATPRPQGPITKPALIVAGPSKHTYSIQKGWSEGKEAWILVNESALGRVGSYETWEKVYEFFEFYQRSAVHEVVEA